MKLKLLRVSKISSKISSRGFSRFSRFLAAFVYLSSLSSLSSVSYFATTENQILHAYKDWTGLISKDVLASADISSGDVLSSDDISSESVSYDISEDIADMAVSNDTPASSDNSNDSNDSFDSFVSHDTNDTEGETEEEADTEDSAEDSVDLGNTLSPVNPVNPVPPVPSGPDTPSDTPSDATPNNPNDSESIAILTTRLTADHHLIATLSISGVMGADVAVFPSVTGHGQHNSQDNAASDNATAPDLAGGNIYTVANTASSPVSADTDNAEKPDSLLLNFENEEGVVESVRLWLDNEIDETVILDGITASNDNGGSNTSSTDMADFSSRAGNGTQGNQPRLALPLSSLSSSDLAAIPDTVIPNASGEGDNADNGNNVNTGYALDWFIGLEQLASPIIVILPDTNEQYYFPNGTALANYANFAQEYKISEINATTRAEIEVRLVRR